MKLLLDFLPILLFFVAFKYADATRTGPPPWPARTGVHGLGRRGGPGEAPVLLATVVVVVATLAQVASWLARGRRRST
jgi:intracellular septation protein